MSRTEELLAAIADALTGSRTDVVIIAAVILGAALLFTLVSIVGRRAARRRRERAFLQRYNRDIRRLDLTILQLDVLDEFARHLHDRSKKHLLLTNENTFRACRFAAGKLAPPLDKSLISLEARLGFSGPTQVSLELERYLPAPGSGVKVEIPTESRRVLATVVESVDRRLRLTVDSGRVPGRGTQVLVYAPHPSGLVVAHGEATGAEGSEFSVSLTRSFAPPSESRQLDKALKMLVRAEGRESDVFETEAKQLWPGGALLDNPDRRFRKHDDIQIVFRRNQARWVVVNAEVIAVPRRKRLMRVRFSHLSREARKEILGSPAAG